jgi:hypothetical protein
MKDIKVLTGDLLGASRNCSALFRMVFSRVHISSVQKTEVRF